MQEGEEINKNLPRTEPRKQQDWILMCLQGGRALWASLSSHGLVGWRHSAALQQAKQGEAAGHPRIPLTPPHHVGMRDTHALHSKHPRKVQRHTREKNVSTSLTSCMAASCRVLHGAAQAPLRERAAPTSRATTVGRTSAAGGVVHTARSGVRLGRVQARTRGVGGGRGTLQVVAAKAAAKAEPAVPAVKDGPITKV